MNNSNANVELFGKLLDKLPKELFEQHPIIVLGGCVTIIALPKIGEGIRYLNDTWIDYLRFKVAAENGLIPQRVLGASKVMLLEEDTVA